METNQQIFEQVFYRQKFSKLFAMYFEANENQQRTVQIVQIRNRTCAINRKQHKIGDAQIESVERNKPFFMQLTK